MIKTKRYGWKPSLPDIRHQKFCPKFHLLHGANPLVDLRSQCPPVYDQSTLGSCTGNAWAGCFQFTIMKEGKTSFVPSRLFVYYNERVIEGTVDYDSGASLSDGAKVLANLGAPHESLWWYDVSKFTVKPSQAVYADGLNHRISQYFSVDNTSLSTMKAALVEGFPVVGGFTVYESFESASVAQTGIVPMPGRNESVLGGHAILVVGYDDTTQRFIVRNSWGTGWGMAGYFTVPYAYFCNSDLASDFWVCHVAA